MGLGQLCMVLGRFPPNGNRGETIPLIPGWPTAGSNWSNYIFSGNHCQPFSAQKMPQILRQNPPVSCRLAVSARANMHETGLGGSAPTLAPFNQRQPTLSPAAEKKHAGQCCSCPFQPHEPLIACKPDQTGLSFPLFQVCGLKRPRLALMDWIWMNLPDQKIIKGAEWPHVSRPRALFIQASHLVCVSSLFIFPFVFPLSSLKFWMI